MKNERKPDPPSTAAHSIHEVVELTGLEESKIRYFEATFREFFERPADVTERRPFTERDVSLLRRIDQLTVQRRLRPADVRRELGRAGRDRTRRVRVLAVTSGKGGVGKTTVAVNLAVALSQAGNRTLVFDADLGMANVHVLAGVRPKYTLMDLLARRAGVEEILTEGPAGIRIVCGLSGVAELADVGAQALERMARDLDRAAREFDFLVVDTAAGIASHVLHFLGIADEILVVATPNTASILDAYGTIKVARERTDDARIALLMNRVRHEREARSVFNNISNCAEQFLHFRPEFLGHLVEDAHVEKSIRARRPYLTAYPAEPNVALLKAMAMELAGRHTAVPANAPRTNRLVQLFTVGRPRLATPA